MKIKAALASKKVSYIFQFLFGALLLLGLFKYQSYSQFLGWSFFISLNFWAILTLRFTIIGLLSERWRLLLSQRGYQVTRFHSFYLSLIGAVLSIFMPTLFAFEVSRWIGRKGITNYKNQVVMLDVFVSVGFIDGFQSIKII